MVVLTGLGFYDAVFNAAIRILFAMGRGRRCLPGSLARLSRRHAPTDRDFPCVAALTLALGLPLTYADGGAPGLRLPGRRGRALPLC